LESSLESKKDLSGVPAARCIQELRWQSVIGKNNLARRLARRQSSGDAMQNAAGM
jgi:hypothetical protein